LQSGKKYTLCSEYPDVSLQSFLLGVQHGNFENIINVYKTSKTKLVFMGIMHALRMSAYGLGLANEIFT
jgi:hypothetical protein